jgi:hypothetical protein
VTSSPTTGSAVVVNMGATTTTAAAETDDDTLNIRGFLSSYPSSGFKQVTASETATGTDGELFTAAATTDSAAGSSYVVAFDAAATALATSITATSAAGAGKYSFTPTIAGTYVLTVWADSDGDGLVDIGEAVQTISLTVAAAAGYSASLSTALLTQDLTDADNSAQATAATDAAGANAIMTLGQKAASIVVTLRNSSNALYVGQTVTATMSGSGFVTAGNGDANNNGTATDTEIDTGDGAASTTRTASIALTASGIAAIGVWGDGTAGTGTVTISVTDQVSGATTTLATKTVSWFGTVATLTATVLQGTATAGATNGCVSATECSQDTLALTPAVVILAKDSLGNKVTGLTITGTSTDSAIVASSAVSATITGTVDANGPGFYNASVTGGSAANIGKSTTVTYSTTLADGVTKITAVVTIKNAGTPATVALSLDKASYAVGEAAVVTVTAKDSAGNLAADGTYANLFAAAATASKSMQGSLPTASVEIVDGIATFKTFAPAVAGDFTVTATGGTSVAAAGRVAVTASASAEGDQSSSLALDAANAATDAANNAYDEAQNATQAASDALAAVTALAAQVKSLIASVKKLTAAVAKLKK